MLQYLIKFSISLAVLFIFYRAVLRPLTFYQWNRFYLLVYSLLSFIIPFIDITSWMKHGSNKELVNIIPSINIYNIGAVSQPAKELSLFQRLSVTDWLLLVFCLGVLVMLIKLFLQYRSLRSIRHKAVLIDTSSAVQLYETAAVVSPFSFGNAIYFNSQLHTEEELQRIIQHEFVHVKQKHTIDLLIGELLCVVNWFNPFAWLIKYSIRQNLEFIADNNVVANGLDKKEYQYLLLKVVGVPQYSIANNFSFSNLKKRIAMMNKMKSARLHLTKFLFVLPLLVVLLIAFRNKMQNEINHKQYVFSGIIYDAKTVQPLAGVAINEKYSGLTTVTDVNGFFKIKVPVGADSVFKLNCDFRLAGYENADNKNLSFFPAKVKTYGDLVFAGMRKQNNSSYDGLTVGTHYQIPVNDEKQFVADPDYSFVQEKFNAFQNEKQLTELAPFKYPGDTIPPPPIPVIPSTAKIVMDIAPQPVNQQGYIVSIADNHGECIVVIKDKSQKIIKAESLVEWNKDKEANESQYGIVQSRPPVPVVKLDYLPADTSVVSIKDNLPADVSVIVTASNIGKKKGTQTNTATVTLKNGKKEFYNLDKPGDKAKFMEKYGKRGELRMQTIPPVPAVPPVTIVDTLKKPLIIIDGVMQPQDFAVNTMNAASISSVNILKPQTAVAVYGDKATNGAVLITLKKPLYLVDKIEQPEGFNIKKIDPNTIESVAVLKDKMATEKYGYKAKLGAVEIKTKQDTGYFPKDVLIIIDGEEIPYGSKIADVVQAENIEIMNVLKDKTATDKYGDKGKNGVIEITTKKSKKTIVPVTSGAVLIRKDKEEIGKPGGNRRTAVAITEGKMTANIIYLKKSHLTITGGSVSTKGKTMVAEGELGFEHGFAEMPFAMYNVKEIKDTNSFKVAKASYNLSSMDELQGQAKYGAKAKYGALEINRL